MPVSKLLLGLCFVLGGHGLLCLNFTGEFLCKANPSCDWCLEQKACFAEKSFCESCYKKQGTCALDAKCLWCPSELECLPSKSTCPNCGSFPTIDKCAPLRGCLWCPSTRKCIAIATVCKACHEIPNQNCIQTTYPGCHLCPDGCQDITTNCTITCNSYTDSTSCNLHKPCEWCAPDKKCLSHSCPPCTDYNVSKCSAHTGCRVCVSEEKCLPSGSPCEECSKQTEQKCTTYAGCEWCKAPAKECADKGKCGKTSSTTTSSTSTPTSTSISPAFAPSAAVFFLSALFGL